MTDTMASLLTPDRLADVAPNGVRLLPNHPRRFGPTTRKLLTRIAAVVGLLLLVGTLLVAFTDATWSRALGLSLVFPGAGFLYEALPVLFALTLLALVLATVLWWGISAQ